MRNINDRCENQILITSGLGLECLDIGVITETTLNPRHQPNRKTNERYDSRIPSLATMGNNLHDMQQYPTQNAKTNAL